MALFSFPEHVTIHVHEHPNPEVLRELKDIKELLIHIKSQNLKLMSNTDQALQDIAGLKALFTKIGGETTTLLQKIIDLQNNAPADTPQVVLDGLADLLVQGKVVDDLVPDAPETQA